MANRATEFHDLYLKYRIRQQKRYYEARRDEYERAHQQALVVRNILLVAAALAGLAGQAAGGTTRAAVAIAAAILATLAGAITAFEALIGFPRLSKLYADAGGNLAEAEIDWDVLDPNDNLTGGIDRVEQIFRKENGQWGQLLVEAGSTADTGPVAEDGATGTRA